MTDNQTTFQKMYWQCPTPDANAIQKGRVVDDIPELLTKKWLCWHFKINTRSGRAGKRMRQLVFTNDLLRLLVLSEDELKKRRTFSRQETLIIIDFLRL